MSGIKSEARWLVALEEHDRRAFFATLNKAEADALRWQ